MSGLGVDKRAFQNIHLNNNELIHIEWITPLVNESLVQYAKRLFEQIQPEDDYYLIGVSFGGMIATEFAKIKTPKKLFLISTIKGKKELSGLYKYGSKLNIQRILPTRIMRTANPFTRYLFGVKLPADKLLLKTVLKETNPSFLKWALNAIANWENITPIEGITIHGSKDKVFPLPENTNYVIENGGHFMVVTQGKEISAILEKELD
ncbi:MAG: alpha/beta hydrolase [Fluviicola sp.]|nr:alpha/beta hydrolase [Fluviicola sp.]